MAKLLWAVAVSATLLHSGAREALAPYEHAGEVRARGRIDELVFQDLRKLGIAPAYLCSDAVFLRRASLDVTGTLPSAKEAAEFLADKNPEKRAVLVDRLLARPEFADYWATKWSDLLRVKAEFPINLWPAAAAAFHRWIRASIAEGKPYDRFVREMLTESGSNFRSPPVNFYRAMQNREPHGVAQTVALTFMGERAEKWPKERLENLAVFFSSSRYKETGEWKEEILYFDPAKAGGKATLPDGTVVRLTQERDPRVVFADWLLAPKNPWFARNLVNRAWYWLLGRGIVHEPDDLRPDNPPSNPALLAYLEQQLVASGYDVKQIFRLILNSNTYQLSSIPADRASRELGAAHFASYPLRRLDAEVLADALCQVTGTGEQYSSSIPEPYTFMPDEQRSVALPDGSISSSFLELFGRPPRDTGLESERNNRITDAQRLHLLNSTHVQRKIQQGPRLAALMRETRPQDVVSQVYLTVLSRFPTSEERQTVAAHSLTGTRGREAVMDLVWSLINSSEFLYRH